MIFAFRQEGRETSLRHRRFGLALRAWRLARGRRMTDDSHKHASLGGTEQPHPDLEQKLGREFVAVVEGRNDKPVSGRPASRRVGALPIRRFESGQQIAIGR